MAAIEKEIVRKMGDMLNQAPKDSEA